MTDMTFPRITGLLAASLASVVSAVSCASRVSVERRACSIRQRLRRPVLRLRDVLSSCGRGIRGPVRLEEGNAIVEFIGWSAVLVVPVLYLVVTLAQIQATTFAVASAADAASRVLEVDDSPSAMDKARVATGLSLSDQGVDADPAGSLSVTCARGCARGQAATVKVAVGVDLPGFASLGIGRDVVVVDTERAITLPGKEEQ
ncbi:Uncharacterised protein [Actinomyces viscosus]|uniref:Pilus assembly protein n=2 Tax=Actinomyces viscosus TaxID=1656 RepID=A0A448PKC4_ACTVI|nr:Uncharacterised protein [Actinomyces viscosus]